MTRPRTLWRRTRLGRSSPRPRRLLAAGIAAVLLLSLACLRPSAGQNTKAADPAAKPGQGGDADKGHVLSGDTAFGRIEGDRVVFGPVPSGARVELLQAGREWSRVRGADGAEGLVPTARLEPKVVEDPARLADAPLALQGHLWLPRLGPEVVPAGKAAPVAEPEVAAAIAKGRQYLLNRLDKGNKAGKGNVEATPGPVPGVRGVKGDHWGTLTALAADALLASNGLVSEDKRLASTLRWLQDAKIESPAALALRAEVLALGPPGRIGKARANDPANASASMEQLLTLAAAGPPQAGLCLSKDPTLALQLRGFGPAPFDVSADRSGPWAVRATFPGLDAPDHLWQFIDTTWRAAQRPDGGWFDNPVGAGNAPAGNAPGAAAVRAGNTAAGAAALLLARRVAAVGRAWRQCHGGLGDANLDAAIAWLDAHADDALEDPAALYAVGRLADAAGRRYLGKSDWFGTGAKLLLKFQRPDGSWPAAALMSGADPDADHIPETAYAVLFLSLGTKPVAINKLAYELPADKNRDPETGLAVFAPGNQRPDDLANLMDTAGRMAESRLAWRTVTLSMSPRDLDAAPVLYLAGSQPLAFNKEEKAALRDYVLRGGLILGNADCGSATFTKSFRDLGNELFPQYEFRDLPPDHPIFTAEMFFARRWKPSPKLVGKSNGVRELMLLVPEADLSAAWQAGQPDMFMENQLGLDLLLYADRSDLLGRGRADAGPLERDRAVKAVQQLRVARLTAGDNPDPEPGGWRRLSNLMHNQYRIDLDVAAVPLGKGQLNNPAQPFRVAHLTGTDRLDLSDAQRDELKAFVAGGGTLIVDAAGGSEKFADSAAAALRQTFAGAAGPAGPPGEPVGKDAPVYNIKGSEIRSFVPRHFARPRAGVGGKNLELRGVAVNGRTAVFFSPGDLSAGLVGQDTDGVFGYAPQTATEIVRNILLFSLGGQAPPPQVPPQGQVQGQPPGPPQVELPVRPRP